MRVVWLLLLLVPLAAAQEPPDVILRYPPQVVYINVDTGASWNAKTVAAAGDATLNVSYEIKILRGELAQDQRVQITWQVEDHVLAVQERILSPGQTRVLGSLQAQLPDLENGTYTLSLHMPTGPWDQNPDNNDPPTTTLRVGDGGPALATVDSRPYLGAFILLGAAVVIAPMRSAEVRKRVGAGLWPIRDGIDGLFLGWPHRTPEERQRIVNVSIAAAGSLLMLVFVIRAGRLALASDPLSILFLALLAGLVALAFKRRLRAMLAPALITLLIAALWQQAATTVPFLRWPDIFGLTPFIVNGLTVGGMYALIALGYTMVYGVLKFINFAHGDVFVWGGYFAWFVVVQYPIVGVPLALLWTLIATAGLGALIERVAYRPLRGGDRLAPLITAIAVSLLLAALAQFFFGTQNRTFTEAGSTYAGSNLQAFFATKYTWGAIQLTALDLTIIGTAALLMVLVQWGIRSTRTGQAMRAVSDDMEAARTVGIPVDRVITITFVVGSALAAVGGLFWGLRFSLRPTLGLLTGIKAFTAAVVGGIGNIPGAFLGGFLIGLAENVGGQFIDSRFQNVIAFLILVIFLLVRPQGMFGKEVRRR